MKKTFYALLTLICFSLTISSFASTNNTHEYTLRNGLKLLVKEDHRSPTVIVQIWYKIGSANEPGGITGISHALEHMMFKGTRKYPTGEFSKLIAAAGGEENAFTSRDYTVYFEKLAKKHLALSFALEADRMRNLLLLPEEFKKEIEVVKEERRMRTEDNAQALTYERFMATANLSNPYHHPIIGWMNDLNNMKIDDLAGWYQTWYAPNNTTIVVVGDVDPRHVHKLARTYFSGIKKQALPSVKPQLEPKSLGQRIVNVSAPAKLPILLMGFNAPSIKTAQSDWEPYALEVLAGILDEGDSSRIPKKIVRGLQIAASASVGFDAFTRFNSLFTFQGIPASGYSVDDLKKALFNEMTQLKNHPVTLPELERVKTQVIAKKVYAQDSLFGQAFELGQLESIGLSWREADNYVNNIKAVTPARIQKVAKKYLVKTQMTIAILHPQSLGTPKKK